MNSNNNLLKVGDINITAAILSTGNVTLVGMESSAPDRYLFLLSPKDVCAELEQSYYNNTLTVSAREMTNRIRELKDILFKEKRREGERYGGNSSSGY